jgi:hypothetical protein
MAITINLCNLSADWPAGPVAPRPPEQMIAFDPKTERMEIVPIPSRPAVVRNMVVDSARRRLWLALSGMERLGKMELTP